ncbi:MAG TPA: hypothetical protein VJ063_21320 [Verrucomicrobiae bacterium]|nr:hypothetical protein [Verrucomicrobiae bacterium]
MKKMMFLAAMIGLLAGCADDRANRGIVYTTPAGSGVLSSGVDAQTRQGTTGQGAIGTDSSTIDSRRRGIDSGTGVGAAPGTGTGVGTGAGTGTGSGAGSGGTSSGGLGGGGR